ncbi:MAG: serine/threonine protein kinase [Bacteroidales bacterium]|nr:serine/threonine protein kinase [Bacteroidales bacterium]
MISESFVRVEAPSQYDGTYTETTPVSGNIYRTRKAGKFFILKTAGSSDARSLQLLRREYELNVRLSHPHIAGVYTFDENSPVGPAIVMEYLEGRTLDKFLKENPPKEARERVFLQLLDAVGYIHRCSLIHNDIKPGNIIITNKDNDLKLIDFGLSDDDSNYLEKNLGATESYASPELLAYRHADSAASESSPAAATEMPATANTGSSSSAAPLPLDSRSDIYSIGMIMKEIFPGRHKRIISRCTQKDREKRYSNTEELKRAWKNRNRSLYAFVATLLLALVILPTVLFLRERSKLAKASASIAEIRHKSDSSLTSITKTADSLRTVSESLMKEKQKEEEYNNLRDSLLEIVEKDMNRAWNNSLAEINASFEYLQSDKAVEENNTPQFIEKINKGVMYWLEMIREEQLKNSKTAQAQNLPDGKKLELANALDKKVIQISDERWPKYQELCEKRSELLNKLSKKLYGSNQ